MKSEDRVSIVAPKDYSLIKLDFIACQVRLYFYLTNQEEFFQEKDVYEKIASKMKCSREIAKISSIKKLFGARERSLLETLNRSQYDSLLEIFGKEIKLDWSKDQKFVFNMFDRPILINSKNRHTIENNLLQSTERDVLLSSLVSIKKYLTENKINIVILFPFHDAVIFMVKDTENKQIIDDIQCLYETSFACRMFSSLKKGKTFGDVA